jgi:hypothetical protein
MYHPYGVDVVVVVVVVVGSDQYALFDVGITLLPVTPRSDDSSTRNCHRARE